MSSRKGKHFPFSTKIVRPKTKPDLRSVEKNEFWGALLEKAYAKLNGSYRYEKDFSRIYCGTNTSIAFDFRALIGGLTIEAAVDFTGGVPELISLTDLQMREDRLFYIMSKADDRGAFMGCSLSVSCNSNIFY